MQQRKRQAIWQYFQQHRVASIIVGQASVLMVLGGLFGSMSLFGAFAQGCNKSYTVVSGDTLASIASRHGTTWENLQGLNKSITDPNMIYIDQTICLSGKGSVGTSSVTGAGPGPTINPYPLSNGGNCTWWAWQKWHDLGYNLPGWGNAGTWASSAQSAGYSLGTMPRIHAIAVFPVDDGVWAYSTAGHVAFVTNVHSDGQTFDVTNQNYGDSNVYTHVGYNVSTINQTQNGQLRFIYFPG